jgi:hemerythrin-like domain-containing protein
MMPIGPLMIEHRLIERMIAVIKKETDKYKLEGSINPQFIELSVDFIRTYADRCHHGKEEDILFRDLSRKPLSADQRRIMEELIDEHRQGRKTVAEIIEAKAKYENGEVGALTTILNCLDFMTDFYPQHIEKEDRHFFLPCMEHFNTEERDSMLHEEWEFDKNLIHLLYTEKVKRAETL